MTTLITLLISLLGYGSPADYADYTEAQLNAEIEAAETEMSTDETTDDGGGWDTWDEASYDGGGGAPPPMDP